MSRNLQIRSIEKFAATLLKSRLLIKKTTIREKRRNGFIQRMQWPGLFIASIHVHRREAQNARAISYDLSFCSWLNHRPYWITSSIRRRLRDRFPCSSAGWRIFVRDHQGPRHIASASFDFFLPPPRELIGLLVPRNPLFLSANIDRLPRPIVVLAGWLSNKSSDRFRW